MRVLYLHQYFNLPSDPGSTRSYEMARRLVKAGHEVFMITSDRIGRFGNRGWYVTNEAGIEVHWLPVPYNNKMSYPQRIMSFLKFALGAARRAAGIPADVVFATSTPLTIALPGVYAAKRQQIPMVFEVRDLWPEAPISIGALKGPMIPPAKWLEKFAYRNSIRIVTVAQRLKSGVMKAGYQGDRIYVIPNGSDILFFNVPNSAGKNFRKRFAWLQENPLVVYAGTIGKVNGVGWLANLAVEVQKINSSTRFLIIGDGIDKHNVKNLARDLGVLNKNFFMLPPVPKFQIPEILSAADIAASVVVNNSKLTGDSANKIFDAFASGTPVAINYGGEMATILRETGAGLVLQVDDIAGAARILVDFLGDADRLKQASMAARKLAETRFNRDNLARELEAVLLEAVEAFGESRRCYFD